MSFLRKKDTGEAGLTVSKSDLLASLTAIRPTSVKEVELDIPKVGWQKIVTFVTLTQHAFLFLTILFYLL